MLTIRVIPCLDVRGGRVVKGVQFAGLRDAGDPAALAARYEQEGADEIVMLDVSATAQERHASIETITRIRNCISLPLTVGGGVRTIDDAAALLNAGADKVGINTAAVADPALIERCADRFGRQCVVIAVDAAQAGPSRWLLRVRAGSQETPLDAVEWSKKASELGAGEVLLTSWDRDGTRTGYDLDLLRVVSLTVGVPVIASGGAASPQHLLDAIRVGADAVLAASIFHSGEYSVRSVKQFLSEAGVAVRP